MSDWQTTARQAAERYGLDPNTFIRQINQESGGRDVTSPAGAQGPAQFMPGTARQVGLSPGQVHQLGPSLDAAAKLMAGYVHQYGSYRNALIAYNAGPGALGKPLPAETINYVHTILGGGAGQTSAGGASPAGASGSATSAAGAQTSAAPSFSDPGQADYTSLLQSLLAHPRPQQQATPLQAPGFAAGPTLPKSFAPIQESGQPPPAQQDVSATLSLLGSLRGPDATNGSPGASTTADGATAFQPIAQQVAGQRNGSVTAATGTAKFDGKLVAAWIAPALQYARQHGWTGTINSGYRSDAEQKRIYDSGVRPAAKPQSEGGGGSNHEFTAYPGGAVDVSQAQQLAQILRNSPYAGKLVWAGGKDPVHFSHPHNGSY